LPSVVFTIMANSSFLIMSTMCGRPSRTLLARLQVRPASLITFAVPSVAASSKPRSTSFFASTTAPGLSRSRTLMRTTPERGSVTPDAAWAFA
jgi:hypothetical protein